MNELCVFKVLIRQALLYKSKICQVKINITANFILDKLPIFTPDTHLYTTDNLVHRIFHLNLFIVICIKSNALYTKTAT